MNQHPTGMEETDKITYRIYKSYILTNRKLDHIFKKYQSFGISISELNSFPPEAKKLLVLYQGVKGTIYYLVDISKYYKGLTWNNILANGIPDPQKHVPIREMCRYNSIEEVPEPE